MHCRHPVLKWPRSWEVRALQASEEPLLLSRHGPSASAKLDATGYLVCPLAAQWKALSDEARNEWKAKHTALKAAQHTEDGTEAGEEGAQPQAGKPSHARPGLPLSLVKKIICTDDEVSRITAAALGLIGHATQVRARWRHQYNNCHEAPAVLKKGR